MSTVSLSLNEIYELAKNTLNVLLKHQQDIDVVQKEVPRLVMASDAKN